MTEPFRDRHRAFREQEIARTAAQLLAELGCRALTMNDVAARLGVSKATLYQHFESRDAMIRRVVGESCRAVLREVSGLADDASVSDRLRNAATLLAERCLGIRHVDDGIGPPCCLADIGCPYVDWGQLDDAFPAIQPVGGHGARLGLARTVQALCAVVMSQRRAEGSDPEEADVEAIVALLLPKP